MKSAPLLVSAHYASHSDSQRNVQELNTSSITADLVLDRYVAAIQPLRTVGSTNGALETEFREARGSLASLVGNLTEGIEGVPDDVAQETAFATGALAVGIDLDADCLATEILIDDYRPFLGSVTTQARTLGSVMADLVPCSNWAPEELADALG